LSTDGYATSNVDELPQIWDGFAKLVRQGLGITAFGVQVMDLPPDYATKSHDESETGQEELYVGLRGSGAIVIDDAGERLALDIDHMVRVSPGVARTLTSGPGGLRVLCVGGCPGEPYKPQDWTQFG
jgi:uncharacterized cupin superfamily protein